MIDWLTGFFLLTVCHYFKMSLRASFIWKWVNLYENKHVGQRKKATWKWPISCRCSLPSLQPGSQLLEDHSKVGASDSLSRKPFHRLLLANGLLPRSLVDADNRSGSKLPEKWKNERNLIHWSIISSLAIRRWETDLFLKFTNIFCFRFLQHNNITAIQHNAFFGLRDLEQL